MWRFSEPGSTFKPFSKFHGKSTPGFPVIEGLKPLLNLIG
jgi:hypothetical protein